MGMGIGLPTRFHKYRSGDVCVLPAVVHGFLEATHQVFSRQQPSHHGTWFFVSAEFSSGRGLDSDFFHRVAVGIKDPMLGQHQASNPSGLKDFNKLCAKGSITAGLYDTNQTPDIISCALSALRLVQRFWDPYRCPQWPVFDLAFMAASFECLEGKS